MGIRIGIGSLKIGQGSTGVDWSSYCTPQNVIATATLDDTIALTWDACDQADSYKIYYGTDGVTFGSSATSTTNIKAITGLTAGTKYYFYVVSVKDAAESNASDTKDATTFTAYYVRPLGGDYGDEDGSSYANAWDGFADIVWATLGAGKVLYICGTHNEALTVGASGLEAQHIIFRGDYTGDPGVIDGTDTLVTCVGVAPSSNYTEWRNLTILQATKTCINFRAGTHWMYDCTITDSGDQNVETNTNANVTLTRCEIFGAVDDGISMHSGASVTIIDCYIHDNYMNIQSSGGAGVTAIGTIFYGNGSVNVGTNNAILSRCKFYGSSSVSVQGTISYCLFDCRTAGATSPILGGGNKTINNCTFIGEGRGRVSVANSTTLTFNNCIVRGLNMFAYVPGDGVLNVNNCNFYNTFKIGIDSNIGEVVGDPLFTNIAGDDFTLQAGSPCRGAGVTGLGYTEDYAGNPVPTTGIDVGCYQCS